MVKILMSRQEPFDKFLTQALQFLEVSVNYSGTSFIFNFEPASTTPFSVAQNLSLIESIKIFGLVRMELVKFIDLKSIPPYKNTK